MSLVSNVGAGAVLAASMLMQMEAASAEEESKARAASSPHPTAAKPLNLRMPSITKMLSPQEIARLTNKNLERGIEEVQVEGRRTESEPQRPTGLAGVVSQFAPRKNTETPDHTSAYKPPPPIQGAGLPKPYDR